MSGIKHLVECHCVLPQFRKTQNPKYHKFIVYSTFDTSGGIIPKFAKCNNCGVIHQVIDVCKSEIQLGKEVGAVLEATDLKMLIPDNLVSILESYNCELPDYEHVLDILQNEEWDSHIILHREDEKDETVGKLLRFKGRGKYAIEPYIIQRVV